LISEHCLLRLYAVARPSVSL